MNRNEQKGHKKSLFNQLVAICYIAKWKSKDQRRNYDLSGQLRSPASLHGGLEVFWHKISMMYDVGFLLCVASPSSAGRRTAQQQASFRVQVT